jgi:hypothetical protein
MRPPYKEQHNALLNYQTNKAPVTDYFSSLQELEAVRTPSNTSQKSARYNNKFRIVPPLVSAYRPLSGSGTTRHKKSLRPKQEPVSPVMSGYDGVCLQHESNLYYTSLTSNSIHLVVKGVMPTLLLATNKQQYHSILRHKSTSTTQRTNATQHSRTKSFRNTIHSKSQSLLAPTMHQLPQ